MSIAALPSAREMALTSELEELYRSHHELIYRTAYSVTGSRPDAEDVLQIIFLRLLRRGLPRDLERNPKGYLYRAAVNVSLNTLRNRKRRTRRESVEPVLVAVHPAEDRSDESRRRLFDAIAQLKPRAVEILILRHVHEYSDQDIARMLGTSRGTVAVALYRADHEGSRVAVIEGEVHVQQGAVGKTLMRGDDLATNASKNAPPVREAIAWSRNAPALVALLQRSAVEPAPALEQGAGVASARFQVVSIRPAGALVVPGARGGGGGAQSRPTKDGCVPSSVVQLDPGRLAIRRATLFQLIAHAYPGQGVPTALGAACDLASRTGLISGGPEWIKTEMWDLEATIPEGTFSAPPALTDPRLQQMLAAALADRFNVLVRRDTREMPVYLLRVASGGPTFNGLPEVPAGRPQPLFLGPDGIAVPLSQARPPEDGEIRITGASLLARNVSMANWADHLFGYDGRPVLDRTGLTGRYDFHYEDPGGRPRTPGMLPDMGVLRRGVLQAVGLELEAARAPFDVWVIERADRPSEN